MEPPQQLGAMLLSVEGKSAVRYSLGDASSIIPFFAPPPDR